mgnify:CR=1 FL=1|jgi:CheY-like chemotaxis protein|tara:strand:+ start:82698 stop:84608 length:1911 start_codon:yes stop_codon:yes gene_type:complete
MKNTINAVISKKTHERDHNQQVDRGLFMQTSLAFFAPLLVAGLSANFMLSWETSTLSMLEVNIISVVIALMSYKALNVWQDHRSAKKNHAYDTFAQSHLNDITAKADLMSRNLIIDILTHCESLKATQRSKVNKERITAILKSTGRLEQYLENALHTIELHNHQQVQPPITVHSFRNSIAEIIEKCAVYAHWHDTILHYTVSPDLPNKMDIDIHSFKVALHNTLQNAITHTQSANIELNIEFINTDGVDSFLCASITATAPRNKMGIATANDDMPHFITKTLIEKAGGFIEYSSARGPVGSPQHYKIYMPFTEHGKNNEKTKHSIIGSHVITSHLMGKPLMHKSAALSPPKILIVDDHPANIMLLHKFIERHSHKQIDEAHNGQQAIRMYNIHHHDIIFMDCQMPNIDGFAASREIRNLEKKSNLPAAIIIGVTADTTRVARKKSHESGMNDLIYKPVTRELLTQTLSKFIDVSPTELTNTAPDAYGYSEIFTQEITIQEETTILTDTITTSLLPVNLKRLSACTEDDHEEEEIFFNLFLEQAKESLYVLEQTLTNHNGNDWCQAAHKLKGSSANLGADQLAELCQIAEHHSDAIADEDILKAIKTELNKVDSFMHTRLYEDIKGGKNSAPDKHMH